jgi:hypothetical protein
MNPPDELALAATSAIDGVDNNWENLEQSAQAEIAADVLRELKVIAGIAEFHRSLHRLAAGGVERWGDLELREQLGSGAFGSVYRAWDPQLECEVALKVYKPAVQDQNLDSVLREGRLLARVRHPNVVLVHAVEQHETEIGLRLELVQGRTLYDEVKQRGSLEYREAVLIGQDLCRAVAAVHQAGLLHRDIKPQNVMRERGGRIVLMDLGIGRDLRTASPPLDLGGTPLYMAPELFAGSPPSVASDIYSLGVTLFYLVTGGVPIPAATRDELEAAQRAGRRRLLRDVRPDLPEAFVQVVERATAADPKTRFASAGVLEQALTRVLSVPPCHAHEQAAKPPRPIWSRPSFFGIAAGVLLAAGVAAWHFAGDELAPTATPTSRTVDDRSRTATGVAAATYTIEAGFHLAGAATARLDSGARVRPGDELYVSLRSSVPVHVYIVAHDDRGESYLLYPLPGQETANPLAAATLHQLPGRVAGEEQYWQVTSAGGREHFLVVASPEPLGPLEQVFAALPRPARGRPVVTAAPLSKEVMGQLRGVGGLTVRPGSPAAGPDLLQGTTALGSGPETVRGPWIRQLTLQNPL